MAKGNKDWTPADLDRAAQITRDRSFVLAEWEHYDKVSRTCIFGRVAQMISREVLVTDRLEQQRQQQLQQQLQQQQQKVFRVSGMSLTTVTQLPVSSFTPTRLRGRVWHEDSSD